MCFINIVNNAQNQCKMHGAVTLLQFYVLPLVVDPLAVLQHTAGVGRMVYQET